MVTIPIDEYKKLLEASVRIGIFADFVNTCKYSVDRDECGTFLGFKVEDKED